MQSLNIWQLFHTYNRLAESGKASRLVCPNDGAFLNTRIKDKDTEHLYLWCHDCGSWSRPGLDVIRQVEAVVKEHYDVRLEK